MKIDQAFASVRKLGLDTAPLIYLVERHPAHVDRVREILRRIDAGSFAAFASVVTLTEVLTLPKRMNRVKIADEYRDLLLRGRNFTLVNIDARIAERASDLRAKYGIRTPDALQIAASLVSGCDAFLTNDLGLTRVSELRMLILQELEL